MVDTALAQRSAPGTRGLPLDAWDLMGYGPTGWARREVHTRQERYIVGCTTRQCGKTTTGAGQIQTELTEPAHPIHGAPWVGVVSHDYAHAAMMVDRWYDWAIKLKDDQGKPFIVSKNDNDHEIVCSNGARVTWHSAEKPTSLAGPTFSALFLDESQLIPDIAWNKLRPTLNVRKARVYAFGTPDLTPDQSWFRGLWLRGQGEEEEDYHSYTIDCWNNPWITYEEIKDARSNSTEDEFRMLYLGQWLDIDGRVFKKYKQTINGTWEDYDPQLVAQGLRGPYIIGLDVALENDFTVAYVFDLKRNKTVAKWRASGLDTEQIVEQVGHLYEKYHAMYIHMDSTGMGNPIAKSLRRADMGVIDFVFSNESKKRLVGTLVRMFEHSELNLVEDDVQLDRELEVFTRKVTRTGQNVTYGHPVNFFDDCVMALGLCALKADEGSWGGKQQVDESYVDFGEHMSKDDWARADDILRELEELDQEREAA